MSSGTKWTRAYAQRVADQFAAIIAPYCQSVLIAGSLRRGKDMVGDVEIVALPTDAHLLVAIDRLVYTGELKKARYTDKNGRISTRWGERYRGFDMADMRVELFIGDAHNIGFIEWLRTGSGEANQMLVQALKYSRAEIRPIDGQIWRVDYPTGSADHPRKIAQISVPTEGHWFDLMGMEFIPPYRREGTIYSGRVRPQLQNAIFVDTSIPKQRSLF